MSEGGGVGGGLRSHNTTVEIWSSSGEDSVGDCDSETVPSCLNIIYVDHGAVNVYKYT